MALFEKTISASQIQEVARSLVDVDKHRDVLLDRMERSGKFAGPKGDPGPKGAAGPPGPQGPGARVLAMVTVKGGQIESKSIGVRYDPASGVFDRTARSHSLASTGQRGRWASGRR